MDVVVDRCAGLDVGKDEVVGCVRTLSATGRSRRSELRTFSTFTSGIEELASWLTANGVVEVVMEATGQYWKPIWYQLEDRDFDLKLVNAKHVKMVPGRKTDLADAAWLAELLEHGLLRSSFVPRVLEVRRRLAGVPIVAFGPRDRRAGDGRVQPTTPGSRPVSADSSFRSRGPISVHPLQRAPRGEPHHRIGRIERRQLRQRPRRVVQRALQVGAHLAARPLARPRGRRVRDPHLHRLVQPPPPPRRDHHRRQLHHPGRVRTVYYRPTEPAIKSGTH